MDTAIKINSRFILKIFSILLIFMTSIFFLTHADAARFGGKRSFGVNRSVSNFSRNRTQALPSRAPAGPNRSWLGPLAGLAAGGLLAYLFMGHGLGTGLLTWIIIFIVIYFIWTLIRPKARPPVETSQFQRRENVLNRPEEIPSTGESSNSAIFPHFQSDEFLRQAKVKFMRLQAAYDDKNLNDLREFTSPEVFGEIQMQLQERGSEINRTEVRALESEILDVSNDTNDALVTVKFSGYIKENENPEERFEEMWHFRKDKFSQDWKVVGVQQV